MPDDLPDDMHAEIREAEMGAEELLGRPLAGNPADRITALQKRIEYLEGCKRLLVASIERGKANRADAEVALQSFDKDLAEARRQLTEWKHQHRGRN